jgi:hypothetical protein
MRGFPRIWKELVGKIPVVMKHQVEGNATKMLRCAQNDKELRSE